MNQIEQNTQAIPLAPPVSEAEMQGIRLFAFLLLAWGAYAIDKMLFNLFCYDTFDLNVGIVALLFGKGILEWRNSYRKASIWLTWTGIIGAGVFAILVATNEKKPKLNWLGYNIGSDYSAQTTYGFAIFLIIFLFAIRHLLRRPAVIAHFNKTCHESSTERWWLPVTAGLLIVFGMINAYDYRISNALRHIQIDTASIAVTDEESGLPISNAVIIREEGGGKTLFPNRITHILPARWEIIQVSTGQPTIYNVMADGYETQKLKISTNASSKTINVELRKNDRQGVARGK